MDPNRPIYICSPLSADTREGMLHNMQMARAYVNEVSAELNHRAIAPHAWLPEILDDTVPEERALAMVFDMEILTLCGTLLICHPTVTKGMAAEIAFAEQHGIAIFIHPGPGKYYPARRIPGIGEAADWGAWGL